MIEQTDIAKMSFCKIRSTIIPLKRVITSGRYPIFARSANPMIPPGRSCFGSRAGNRPDRRADQREKRKRQRGGAFGAACWEVDECWAAQRCGFPAPTENVAKSFGSKTVKGKFVMKA